MSSDKKPPTTTQIDDIISSARLAPDLEQAIARTLAAAPPMEPEPYTTQIDWQAFVMETPDGKRGLSLRKLVEAGLYSRYDEGLKSLNACGFDFSSVGRESTGGRPSYDHIITDLADAQMFCIQARTDVGKQIARLIIDHHTEFQALLNGDATAHAKLAAAAPAATPLSVEAELAALDPMLAMIYVVKRTQAEQAASLQEHSDALATTQRGLAEVQARFVIPQGWISAEGVARACGAYSKGGLPHNTAILALARSLGLETRTKLSEAGAGHEAVPSSYLAPEAVVTLSARLRELREQSGSRIIHIRGASKTYTVCM